MICVVSGPSGVGKGTIVKGILARDMLISPVVSYTSRPQKTGELDGVDYHFVSRQLFERMADDGEFLEYKHVYGNYYGTPIKGVRQAPTRDVLLEIDCQGAVTVKGKWPSAKLIFILPPSKEVLEQRLRDRARENDEEIQVRIGCASQEIKEAQKFDHWVVNDNVEIAVSRIHTVISLWRRGMLFSPDQFRSYRDLRLVQKSFLPVAS